jgi:hypothetical protein
MVLVFSYRQVDAAWHEQHSKMMSAQQLRVRTYTGHLQGYKGL